MGTPPVRRTAEDAPAVSSAARVPKIGKSVGVRVDAPLREDLEVLLHTGLSLSNILREAVAQAAAIHRGAWSDGCPPGVLVRVADFRWMPASDWRTTPPEQPGDTP